MRYKYPLPRDTRLNNMRNDAELLDHILAHIDNGTTDLGEDEWLEPVENYAGFSSNSKITMAFFQGQGSEWILWRMFQSERSSRAVAGPAPCQDLKSLIMFGLA